MQMDDEELSAMLEKAWSLILMVDDRVLRVFEGLGSYLGTLRGT